MEVLIVVAIIAVLVAIAIPVYNGVVEKARVAADAVIMRQAQSAFVAQEIMTGEKPPKRAVYDIVSNTFIDYKNEYFPHRYTKYKNYGQAKSDSNSGWNEQGTSQSKGINGHIYVDLRAGEDYGPEDLVWWAEKYDPAKWR
jgi:type II secretory pathway pseudopilin PulG